MLSWFLVVLAAAFIVLMTPVSLFYDRTYRRTVAEYAEMRRERGATEGEWPPPSMRREIFVNPGLFLTAGLLAAGLAALGALDEVLRTDPFGWLPGFVPDPRLPALLPAVAAGAVAAVAFIAYSVRAFASPWWPVQSRLRVATSARGERRRALLAEALRRDPDLSEDGRLR